MICPREALKRPHLFFGNDRNLWVAVHPINLVRFAGSAAIHQFESLKASTVSGSGLKMKNAARACPPITVAHSVPSLFDSAINRHFPPNFSWFSIAAFAGKVPDCRQDKVGVFMRRIIIFELIKLFVTGSEEL